MPLTLTVTSYQRLSPDQEVTKVADQQSVSIGRAQDNDWALPDPERYLSGRHCLIEYRDGGYYLTDTSTNGVFINDRQQRVGRGQQTKLKDGDLLILGEYEIEVSLPPEAVAPPPPADELFGDETLNTPTMGARSSSDLPPDAEAQAQPEDDDFSPVHTDPLGLSWSGAPTPEATGDHGGSTADHVPEEQSFFRPPDMAQDMIPEEWDEEWLGPRPSDRNTSAAAPTPPSADGRQTGADADTQQKQPPRSRTPEGRTPEGRTPEGRTPETPATPEPSFDVIPEDLTLAGRTPEGRTPEGRTPEGRTPEGRTPDGRTPDGRTPDGRTPDRSVSQPSRETPPPAAHTAASTPRQEPSAPSPGSGDAEMALLQAFLRGARVEGLRLSPQQAEAQMEVVGAIFRQMAQGLMEALAARRQIKNEFRLSQTSIRPVENNPFKFSLSVDDAIATVLTKRGSAYLAPDKAVQEGFKDIQAHEVAVMAGTQAALSHLLRRFDPRALEERLGQQSMLANLVPGMRKAKYWDVFKLLYEDIAREAEDDFQELFGREFARAYEEQVRKL